MSAFVQINISAAVAEAAGCGFDCGANQLWTDILASALSGLVLLPLAVFFAWFLHRLKIDRWLFVTATLATILSALATEIVAVFVWNIFYFAEQVLKEIGVNRFVYLLLPNLLVCFVGAFSAGFWFKYHRRADEVETP